MTRRFGLPALVLVAALLVTGAAYAADGKAGSTYTDVFGIGVGAGPSALAAYTAVPGGLWSLTYNPAGVYAIPRLQLGVSQIEWFDDTSFSYLGLGLPRGDGGLAVGLAYFDKGSVAGKDWQGTDIDAADAYDFGFIGGYGFHVPNICALRGGVSGHVIQASLDDKSATAIGVNLGLLYGLMEDQVQLGLAVRNLGTKLEFDTGEDEQALTFAGGVSYMTMADQIPNVDVTVGLDASMPKDQDFQFAVGGEVWVYKTLALRVGYHSGPESGNLGYGAGFKYGDFQLDYTYADYEDLQATHRISLTMGFGD
jgi:hypothetical protein